MNKEETIRFAGLMEDYLNIPSFVCEMIQQQLEENKYKEVVEYVVQRRNEIESKPDFISDRNAITMLVNQNEQKDKEIERLNNIIEEKTYLYNKLSTESEYTINKLNNIINELEKDIKDELKKYNRQKYLKNPAKSKIAEFKEDVLDYMLYKLKELKEGK